VEVVASLSQGRTAVAQCGLFTYKSVPVIFEPPCIIHYHLESSVMYMYLTLYFWRPMIQRKRKIEPIRERYFSQNYPTYTFTCTLKIFKKN